MSRSYYLTLKITNYFATRLLKLSYKYRLKNQCYFKNKIAYELLYLNIQILSIFMKGPRVAFKFIFSGKLIFIYFLPIIALIRKIIPKQILLFILLFLYSNQIFKNLRIKIITNPELVRLINRKITEFPKDDSKIYKFAIIVSQFEIDSNICGITRNYILNINAKTFFSKQRIVNIISISSNIFHSAGYFEDAEAIERLGKELLDKEIVRSPGNYFESNYATAIGHISLMDMIIKGRKLNLLSPETFNIVIDENKIANSLYFNILKREAIKSGISFVTDCDNKMLEPDMEMLLNNKGDYVTARKLYGEIEYKWKNNFGKPLISFAKSDFNYIRVEKLLKEKGIDISKPIVGFHFRINNDFLKSGRGSDFRKIESIIYYLTSHDLNVIRIGTERIFINDKFKRNNYFDLFEWNLSKEEFELVCLYVWSKSLFFIGNLSGGTMPPNTFGTPTFWFDVFPLAHVRLPGLKDYFIPKTIYSYELERNLTFSEMFTYPESQSENPFSLIENGYRLIDSSGLDIINGIKNMLDIYLYHKKNAEHNYKVDQYESVYMENGFTYGAKIDLEYLSKYKI